MLKRLAGFGCLALLLCLPLNAEHRRHRSHRHGGHVARGYVEVHIATPHGHGVFVRGFRPAPYGRGYRHSHYGSYGPYGPGRREFRKFNHKHRKYFKRHRHYHYDGHCPY